MSRKAYSQATSAATQPELKVKYEHGRIWSHIRKRWLDETPEERVRQEYLCVLVNEYGGCGSKFCVWVASPSKMRETSLGGGNEKRF